MRTDFMLLAIYNKPRLTFSEVCEVLGYKTTSGHTMKSNGRFPVPLSKNNTADIRDVANALDEIRKASA